MVKYSRKNHKRRGKRNTQKQRGGREGRITKSNRGRVERIEALLQDIPEKREEWNALQARLNGKGEAEKKREYINFISQLGYIKQNKERTNVGNEEPAAEAEPETDEEDDVAPAKAAPGGGAAAGPGPIPPHNI